VEGDSNPNKNTEEIIGEVKTRLFRSQVPWLLVFDNLEDRKMLEHFVPHGGEQILFRHLSERSQKGKVFLTHCH